MLSILQLVSMAKAMPCRQWQTHYLYLGVGKLRLNRPAGNNIVTSSNNIVRF